MASSSRPEEAAAAAPPWSRLEGRVVLVTGASSGLGREFCLDLARAGCLVVAAARRADLLRSLCDEINASAPRASAAAAAVELDVASGGPALEAAVQSAWDAFGRIDVLINNAGLRGGVHSPLDWPEDEWDTLIKTNLTGSWLVAKHVCRRMHDAKLKGSVINISSVSGLNRGHLPGSTGYTASKSAMHYVTKLMALELGAYGIRVNSIAPGIFKSEITAPLLQKKWLNTVVSKIVPLKTHGTTDPALTSLVRFLIHETSSYVTGNIFVVDSGATLPGVPIFSSL
uniref:Ketoreductase domain-containing protein n=1 Tax=Oryza glumipatula TaxID=40148 RepID=A0A0E0AXI1_9ORYZ